MTEADRQSLVIIGSTGGDRASLVALISSLPEDFPAPVIIAQHTDGEQADRLAATLSSSSKLTVQVIQEQHALVTGTIYIVEPATEVTITEFGVQVVPNAARATPSVDQLFAAAASVFRENLIAVVLSGVDTDGLAGLCAVKAHDGVVVSQAIQTTSAPAGTQSVPQLMVDYVVPAEAIGPLLYDLVTGAYSFDPQGERDRLQRLLAEVQARTGVDYASYKLSTLSRRVQKRMLATDCRDLAQYLAHLDDHPEEFEALAQSFLISATEFFRDPDVFAYLLEGGLQDLVARAVETGELRVWAAGCATGEEAYSLALVVCEALEDKLQEVKVRVFATDIDTDAIAYARRGMYPARALKNLPEHLIERYFEDHGEIYEVGKALRALVVFGEHDLSQRLPFPRIDMVACRNVLIYFGTELQRRVLQLFAFALRDGGLLMLGKAESVAPLPNYFVALDAQLKVYRRQGEPALLPPLRSAQARTSGPPPLRAPDHRLRDTPAEMAPSGERHVSAARRRLAEHAERALRAISIGIIIISRDYRIQYTNAAARRHFGSPAMAINDDLMHVVHHVDLTELRDAIEQALQGHPAGPRTFRIAAPDEASDDERYVEFSCTPLAGEAGGSAILVQTSEVTGQHRTAQHLEETTAQLQRQIAAYRNLEATNRRLTEINSELHAGNEELLISNEEFRAATEEVETLNEELHATNEELETLNEELQATIEELNTTNEDLELRSRELEQLVVEREEQRQDSETERARLRTVLAHMDEAVLLIDETGAVIVTNAAFDAWFGADGARLAPTDADGGRLADELWPQHRAAAGETFTSTFAFERDGEQWLVEAVGRPVTGDGERRGGVVVFRRIDAAP